MIWLCFIAEGSSLKALSRRTRAKGSRPQAFAIVIGLYTRGMMSITELVEVIGGVL